MSTIVGISGSFRKDSFNSALLRAAAELSPVELRVEVETIRGIPLYDGDVEKESGLPQVVIDLKQKIAAASGLLLVTPEYNNSLPGVLKNAIDWLSRPAKDIPRIFGGRPVAIMGATPGRGGTRMAQTAWLPVMRTLGMQPWFEKTIHFAEAGKLFESGRLVDEASVRQVREYMAGFAAFVARITAS
jgi:NAD(P)H-dependent FMN reductase